MNTLVKCRHIPVLALLPLLGFAHRGNAQSSWLLGGELGMSIVSGGGSSNAGFQIGPLGEVIFNKNFAVGSEFTINSQAGTPVVWVNYFKYYFKVTGSKIRPYADGGFLLDFVASGPYFGLLFGGGANFWLARDMYIPADIQLGPIFGDPTAFDFAITTGVRFEIP